MKNLSKKEITINSFKTAKPKEIALIDDKNLNRILEELTLDKITIDGLISLIDDLIKLEAYEKCKVIKDFLDENVIQ